MSTEMPNNFQAFRTTIYMVQTYIYTGHTHICMKMSLKLMKVEIVKEVESFCKITVYVMLCHYHAILKMQS